MMATRPALLHHPVLALSRSQRPRAKASQHRLFITTVQGAFCVLLLSGLLGYAFLAENLIYFRRSVLAFNPNVGIGPAKFKLLAFEFFDYPGGPSCVRGRLETLLIQTTATRFEDIITYSRRIASPNDHNLTAVFVRDTVAGQPWKILAERGFQKSSGVAIVPSNWLAKLHLSQGGMESDAVHSYLVDLQGYVAKHGLRVWRADINYHTDSLTEHQWFWCRACGSLPAQKTFLGKRRLAPTDAAYYSPYRLQVRRWKKR